MGDAENGGAPVYIHPTSMGGKVCTMRVPVLLLFALCSVKASNPGKSGQVEHP